MTATLAPATTGVITLDDEWLGEAKPLARGRTAKEPEYLTAVSEALATGDRKGVPLPEQDMDKAARLARNKINAACKHIGPNVKAETKVMTHPKHGTFLMFTVTTEPTVTA